MVAPAMKRDVRVQGARYLREPNAVYFPSEETVPESKRHLMMRTALFQLLTLELGGRFAIGSDQFVYWNARDPGRRLAPDVFVATSHRDFVFDSWKTWEHGAPNLAVEITSPSDAPPEPWARKLERYQEAGVQELVRFHPDAPEGERLRVWDRIDGDLVERAVEGDRALCNALSLTWVVRPSPELGPMLRLARDQQGAALLPTLEEARAEEERRRAEEERRRAEEERRRVGAEQRVSELEAELRKVRGDR
jgi:Uma2 family endonuclease